MSKKIKVVRGYLPTYITDGTKFKASADDYCDKDDELLICGAMVNNFLKLKTGCKFPRIIRIKACATTEDSKVRKGWLKVRILKATHEYYWSRASRPHRDGDVMYFSLQDALVRLFPQVEDLIEPFYLFIRIEKVR